VVGVGRTVPGGVRRAHGASEAAARAAPASARSAWRAGRTRRAGPGRAVGRGAARTLAATTRRHVALGPLPLGARLPLAGPSFFCQRVAPPWGRPSVMSLVVPLSHPERPGASATGCNGTTSSEGQGGAGAGCRCGGAGAGERRLHAPAVSGRRSCKVATGV
jgi:hypothetical protein